MYGHVRPWNLWVWCSFLFRLSRNRSIWWCLHCSRLQGLHQDVCLTSFANDFTKPQWSTQLYSLLELCFTALPKGHWQLRNSVWFFGLALESEVSTVGTTDTTSTVSARAWSQDPTKASWLQPIATWIRHVPFTQPCHHHPQPRGRMTWKTPSK